MFGKVITLVCAIVVINLKLSGQAVQIDYNSTSGSSGMAHITLQESQPEDFNRIRFQNRSVNGFWTLAARATDGQSLLNVFYNDGSNFANLMSFDGDLFRVGIHREDPGAYLHIKQQNAGVDALKFENDDATGGEEWGWRIGDNDILIYFEGDIRGSFNSDDGVYTNFPPPSTSRSVSTEYQDKVLSDVMKIKPKRYVSKIGIDPIDLADINNDWVSVSEDGKRVGINYQQLTVIAIKTIQEQQVIIDQQNKRIREFERSQQDLERRMERLEELISGKDK